MPYAHNQRIGELIASVSKHQERIFLVLTYWVIFLYLVFPYADKDWGWHYRLGKYFVKTGNLLLTNPFTWTLPDYLWTNHEWLYDPLLYLLYHAVGFLGLSILGGFVAFLTFYIVTKPFKLSCWKTAIVGFFFVRLSDTGIQEGLRSQVIANLLLAILLWILIKARQTPNRLFALPFLFLFWANLHGTVILGLGVAAVFLVSYFIINRRYSVLYLAIASVASLVTLINPFGTDIYLEAFKHFSSPYLEYVLEWLPIYHNCPYCHQYTFYLYAGLLAFIFVKARSINALPYMVLSLLLLIPTINARRYLPVFAVATLPALGTWLENVDVKIEQSKAARYLALLIIAAGLMHNLFIRYPNHQMYTYSEADYCYHANGCSPATADFLIEHPVAGRGFNFYDWGGYYIGKGIPEKLFIDGRMHLWEQNGYMPFVDFIDMYYYENDKLFNNYAFDWVLVPLNSHIGRKIAYSGVLGKWRIAFRDGNSVLYTRQ